MPTLELQTMDMIKCILFFMHVVLRVASANPGSKCVDKEILCEFLASSIPAFCTQKIHDAYVMENCQKSCGLCPSTSDLINHDTNLIWAQSPSGKTYAVARLVAIQGNPRNWTTSRRPQVTYIGAPHFTWEFKSLGFHWEDQTLFWSEGVNKKIQCLVLNGSVDTLTLYTGTSSEVYGIAVDWLSRNLYFTDALYNWIMMISTDPNRTGYKIIIQDWLDSPHGLAVYPQKGYLFWSDWGARPKIEVSSLLGESRTILVEKNIVRPRGLAIDYSSDTLYWVDMFKYTLESVRFDGSLRKVIHREEGTSFYGVALYENFLFLTERSKGMLKIFDNEQRLVSFTLGNTPYDIIMYDESQQPGNSSDCENLGCEQMCVLDPKKGAACICGEGFTLEEGSTTKCKVSQQFVHPSHIYAIRDSICHYPANLADMSLANITLDSQCFLEDRQGYTTLTFDARENTLYYFGNNSKTISRIPLEVGGKGKLVTGGSGEVKGMALDWVAGNLYWTDCTNRVIKVAKKNGSFQRILLDNLTNPMAIAVHPGLGEIYWTDHGRLPDVAATVEKANMDGTDRTVIVRVETGQPNHLYVDYEKNCVYWADSILFHVTKYNLTNGKVSVVYEQTNVKFYGLSMFKDYILWTDTDDLNGIHVARLDKQEKVRGIIHPKNGVAADLITFDIKAQPDIKNLCNEAEYKCSHLCLLTRNKQARCLCGNGYVLSSDGFTCNTDPYLDHFLLVNDAFQRQIFQVSLVNGVETTINLMLTHEPVAVSFDPFDLKVFWSDNKANVIKEATLDGQFEKEVTLLNNMSMCDGLAIDYLNRLIFYTDTGNDVIGVISQNNYDMQAYIVTSGLDEPRDIVVSPNQGVIFWSDWGARANICRSNMDGSNVEVIVKFNSTAWPNGLALDLAENNLYWVDAHGDTVNVIDLATRVITVLMEEPGAHYFSIEVSGEFLYVGDWKKNYLRRMKKKGGTLEQFGPSTFTRLYGIKGYNSSERFRGISVCAHSACDHLCLPQVNNLYTCVCTTGYVLVGQFCKPIVINPPTTPTTTESSTTSPTTSSTTSPTATTVQSTSTLTSTITGLPTTMYTDCEDTTFEIDTIITTSSIDHNITDSNATFGSSTAEKSTGLSSSVITAIVCSVFLAVAAIALSAAFVKRHYRYKIQHQKLIEDQHPTDFYKIAFNSPGDETVTFDTGIENPVYDCLNNPSHTIPDSHNSSA